MGLLNFKYRKRVANKERLAEKIAEVFRDNGIGASENNGEIAVSGLKSYFNTGSATIKVDDTTVTVEGSVKPSVAAMVCMAISFIFDMLGLFCSCELEAVLVMALVIALGAAGTIGSIIMFFAGKEFLRQNVALLVGSAEK